MERWIGKVAVVTGASSGIGAAIAFDLTKQGLIVIGLAPFIEQFNAVKKLVTGVKGEFHPYPCDVRNEKSVQSAFDWIDKKFGRINILVNNAGLSVNARILDEASKIEDLLSVINTNIVGLLYCTRAAFKVLKRTGEIGHIINIGSVAGHNVPVVPFELNHLNVYPGSKYCIRAITEVLRQELMHKSKQVRVSVISPGVVKTPFFTDGGYDTEIIFKMPHLQPEDVSAACLYMLGTPSHVQVHDMIIKAIGDIF